ncbi:MAG: hypothetical protein LBQ59_03040 [Candidatus Peribacteria bacterium]|nr:hypothetical protein [Candidatus Peribacteria bacterium]
MAVEPYIASYVFSSDFSSLFVLCLVSRKFSFQSIIFIFLNHFSNKPFIISANISSSGLSQEKYSEIDFVKLIFILFFCFCV